MPRDVNGNFTLTPQNPVVSGTVIETAWANPTLQDIANALTDSLSRSGNGGMSAPFKFSDGTKSAPGESWSNEPTAGWYRAATHDFRFAILNTDTVKITSPGLWALSVTTPGQVIAGLGDGGPATPTVQAGAADGKQYTERIYGANAANKAPLLSLFRSGAKEYFIAGGTSELLFGVTNGLADYNDATLQAAAQLRLSQTAATLTVPMNQIGPILGMIGMIGAFIGPLPPFWLALNGATITEAVYPRLFAALGKTGAGSLVLPDTKGMFLRGVDNTNTVDPDGVGRVPGYTVELPAIGKHQHTVNDPGHFHLIALRALTLGNAISGGAFDVNTANTATTTDPTGVTVTGVDPDSLDAGKVVYRADDPRPVNLAVYYAIYADA